MLQHAFAMAGREACVTGQARITAAAGSSPRISGFPTDRRRSQNPWGGFFNPWAGFWEAACCICNCTRPRNPKGSAGILPALDISQGQGVRMRPKRPRRPVLTTAPRHIANPAKPKKNSTNKG